eukprot:SAG31_NODE_1794_length_7249_cov_4.709231_6_plen_48_part_00
MRTLQSLCYAYALRRIRQIQIGRRTLGQAGFGHDQHISGVPTFADGY